MKKNGTGTLGDYIRRRRKQLGIAQKDLCEKLGIGRTMLSHYENNTYDVPYKLLPSLATALQTDYECIRGFNWQTSYYEDAQLQSIINVWPKLCEADKTAVADYAGMLGLGSSVPAR